MNPVLVAFEGLVFQTPQPVERRSLAVGGIAGSQALYKKHAFRLFLALLLCPWLANATPAQIQPGTLYPVLQDLPGSCGQPWSGIDAAALERLKALYREHHFEPLWTDERVDQLLTQLGALTDDGLEPAAYAPETIRRFMQPRSTDPLQQACSDAFASHAYLTALLHLATGRLQQEPIWRSPDAERQAAADAPLLVIASEGLAHLEQAFNKARPSLQQYHNLRKAYARLREQPLTAPWPAIPSGKTLRLGMVDPRVTLLRERLSHGGYLDASSTAPTNRATPSKDAETRYGSELETALKSFQQRHGLQDDGILGADTLQALNATPTDRLNQLRVNLERFRRLARDIEPRSLLVDIAGGRVIYFRDSSPQWEARSQVGRDSRQTPQIKSKVTRLTLNPTWTIPPTILREDKLPQIRANLGYLAEHKLKVLDYEGRELDPATIDWTNPGRILLRQSAGPDNPLGRVVIRFANPYSIYLHDTPSQGLFTRSQRAFSSGCVRVESVMQLVNLLLTDAERERVAQLLESGQTYEFRPAESTPILLAYWTAEADSSGQPRYRPDLYHRDPQLLTALQSADRHPLLPGVDGLRHDR